MDWGDLHYFLALARHGTLSATARELAVEHTTIARRVSSLETTLGVRLFDRLPRGWRLTREGRDLVEPAASIERDVEAFALRARGAATALSVRVSAPPVMVTHFLAARVAAFARRAPHVALDLISDRRGVDLLRGEADVALRIGPVEVSPGLIVRDLGKVGYGLYGTRAHVRRKPVDQVFCGFDASMAGAAQKQWLDAFAGRRPVVLRSNDLLALFEAARAGVGIALLPHFLVGARTELERLPVDGENFERSLSLIVHPDLRRARHVQLVVQFLGEVTREARSILLHPRAVAARAR